MESSRVNYSIVNFDTYELDCEQYDDPEKIKELFNMLNDEYVNLTNEIINIEKKRQYLIQYLKLVQKTYNNKLININTKAKIEQSLTTVSDLDTDDDEFEQVKQTNQESDDVFKTKQKPKSKSKPKPRPKTKKGKKNNSEIE